MKLLYLTTIDSTKQGDFQEVCTLHGLRNILGDSCIDYPKKKVLYRDFSESPQESLHGKGFTLYTQSIQDIPNNTRNLNQEFDYILYGVTNAYGISDFPEINKLSKNIWYLDGHDHSEITKTPCFKRELFDEQDDVYPTGFGIPINQIRPLNFNTKIQYIQKTTPKASIFQDPTDLGNRHHYIFTNEDEYYQDMSNSWFGLTSMKGGWDSLRHYEILASGACLLFRDYDKKPPLCAPQNLPCYSYSTFDELTYIMNRLVVNNKPTEEYYEMVFAQREWLLKYGTTKARALEIIKTMLKNNKK